ncbi:BaiN/RdsA family NAD(P)/FAD-dependent oxidoreductase [Roseococcus microcysteis]|uniref:NAD(P)/FAD-dependent oxidoreductase n=1 Tax=Roseococcus microcysteis TaxID=2771361 RepID=UPI00168AD445|nr:TIGR03862 family flavoprotein [Roseococcus microcysteis]
MTISKTVAVVGAGPAGLMAAEILAQGGARVTVYDAMARPGRKFLLAGRGGLNLTHSEALPRFLTRYPAPMRAFIEAFPPQALIAWCEALGQPVFTGSSGRVFPVAMKASPLLRAWLRRLEALGVALQAGWRWRGFGTGTTLRFDQGEVAADAVILACGGASWPQLGSDGAWVGAFPAAAVAPLAPANMGFEVAWSAPFAERFAGTPLKRIALNARGQSWRGEAMVSARGIEGGVVYAAAATLRAATPTTISLDLRPDLDLATLRARLGAGAQSLANRLRRAGLAPVAAGLVQEALRAGARREDIAGLVKALPLRLEAPMGLARAISTAGGLRWEELDPRLMLRDRPGIFCAGEMLDWEAPTGGYLLQGCFATGQAAGRGALDWLRSPWAAPATSAGS